MSDKNEANKYAVLNIFDFLKSDEQLIASVTQTFSSINKDIENFIKYRAIEFAKKKQAVTYFVFNGKRLAGYFTLAVKTFKINGAHISKTLAKKLQRVCTLDETTGYYYTPAILIAQLGKNFTRGMMNLIDGEKLLRIAMSIVLDIQYRVGGIIVFLECEKVPSLLDFYHTNGFQEISTRNADNDKELVQFYKFM